MKPYATEFRDRFGPVVSNDERECKLAALSSGFLVTCESRKRNRQ
jgi:hypothetical protein